MLDKFKEIIKKSSFQKTWTHLHDGHRIEVINWWTLFGINGEQFHLNGELVKENFYWFLSVKTQHVFSIDEVGQCRIVIGTKWYGTPGCHIFINNKLVGGDTNYELAP